MAGPALPRRLGWWSGWALAAGTMLLCLAVAEFALRWHASPGLLWHFPNFVERDLRANDGERDQLRYDPVLGWDLQPEVSGLLAGRPITISADGMRSHSRFAPLGSGPPILALGDSYTEGYAVGDDETWPAHLERTTGRPVLSAGVRDYGIDQVVLKAERLVPVLKPAAVVLAFIASDIDRTARAVRSGRHKPFFAATAEGLELRNVPVPVGSYTAPYQAVRRILGHSLLVHFAMNRLGAYETWHGDSLQTGENGDLLSCRLMERFGALMRRENTQALVVALPRYEDWAWPRDGERQRQQIAATLECAARAGLPILDAYDAFARAGVARDPEAFFVERHFNEGSNSLAARLIASGLATGSR